MTQSSPGFRLAAIAACEPAQLLAAFWRSRIQPAQQLLRDSQIRIELQYSLGSISRLVHLPGAAQSTRQIHAYTALSRSTLKRALPKNNGFPQVSMVGFENAQIRRCID